MRLNDLTGREFSRLTVLYRAENKGKKTYWWCRCRCGTEKAVWAQSLVKGAILSCKCLNNEALGNRRRSHGLTRSPTYRAWQHMIERCEKPETKNYEDYGARGITVCSQWHKFNDFLYDMGVKPKGMELDRRDNNGNYEPGNCRWTTKIIQANNKRSNKFLTFSGKTQTIRQWEAELSIARGALWARHKRHPDWLIERLFFTPFRKPKQHPTVTLRGRTQTIQQWARELHMTPQAIFNRRKTHPDWLAEQLLAPITTNTKKEKN